MITRLLLSATLLGSTLLLAACGQSEQPAAEAPASPTVHPDVAKALDVGAALAANPAAADSILDANGLTRGGLDSLMYRIAADSTLSAQYAAGRP